MNDESSPASVETASGNPLEKKPAVTSSHDLEEDEFMNVKLRPRQQSAHQEIVCEGGCE